MIFQPARARNDTKQGIEHTPAAFLGPLPRPDRKRICERNVKGWVDFASPSLSVPIKPYVRLLCGSGRDAAGGDCMALEEIELRPARMRVLARRIRGDSTLPKLPKSEPGAGLS